MRAPGLLAPATFGVVIVVAAVVVALVAPAACTTAAAGAAMESGSAEPGPHAAALSAFAAALARDGMSVGVAPRVCVPGVDDVAAPPTCDPAWDDDVGCVVVRRDAACASTAGAIAAAPRALLVPYARAMVKAHVKVADAARADALVDAWLAKDQPRLASLAQAIEADFDKARAASAAGARASSAKTASSSSKAAGRGKPKPAKKSDAAPASGAGADAGPADGARALAEGGGGDDDEEDAGPGALTLKERVVGTWTSDEGPLRNIYALCDGGDYVVRYEMSDASLGDFAQDMPVVHGKWAAHDGDPPTLELSALGESMTATITELTDETLEISLEGETVTLARKSKSASCD